MAKYNYVTLFNLNYLNRGLLMYKSLEAVSGDFNLYVVCFDNVTYEILTALNYKNLIPVSLKDFEDEELLNVKPGRTAAEYCWTCSSCVIWYCLNTFKLDACAYIDADMYFYSDPAKIWNENPDASVYITLHNYSRPYDQSLVSGKFCVQFVGFKNNTEGRTALEDWRKKCIEWCFNRIEDGKFGDQKYLDEWPVKFKGVHIVNNPTAGLAPWNIQQFKIINDRSVVQKNNNHKLDPVFFHFHGLKICKNNVVSYTSDYYDLNKDVQSEVYRPYAEKLLKMDKFLREKFPGSYNVIHGECKIMECNAIKWLKLYLYDIRNDIKNINGNFTSARFKNNYTRKIDI